MADTLELDRPAKTLSFDQIQAFLYAEARALDDRQWDHWLTFYRDDCDFWMPAWDDFDKLTEDPQTEISLIYYADKSGIRDRVFRIQTDRSSATSLPEPRTNHNLSNIEVLSQQGGVAYEGTDPTQIPVHQVTGAGTVLPGSTEVSLIVQLPTDAGLYNVTLTRPDASAPWLADRIRPAQG